MKKLLAALALLWIGGAAGYWYLNDAGATSVEFRTVRVRRGDLKATINATGTIEPEEVVDVGTQVEGEILEFGPDPRDPKKPISFGSPVEPGTVLARIDDALYRARVDQAKAGLAKAEADIEQAQAKLRQAERDLERNRQLQNRRAVSPQEFDASLADFETARAAVAVARGAAEVARANLQEAEVNLRHTTITSPVRGIVLDRRVNIGQTVVASFNAPSLFLIAKDLSRMEIWASVNETDVGAIHEGQTVHFTVGAFPDQTFRGAVSQIRLNASMVQNVVTYTVVVAVDNAGGRLLPYLTARLRFEVEERAGVLLVPNAALRWQPRPELVVEDAREEYRRSLGRRAEAAGDEEPPGSSGKAAVKGMLWVARGEFVRPVPVQVGLSDGLLTEVSGEGMSERMAVVVGVVRRDEAADAAAAILPHINRGQSKKK